MSSYTENKGQLVINLMDSAIYQDLVSRNQVNLNELYLIRGQDTDEVVDVRYVQSSSKFVYETADGDVVDIVTLNNLKSLLGYSAVASSGQYPDLTGKPSINGVELSGNKTTSDLNISLNYTSDSITNKPQINGVTLTGNISSSNLGISYDDLTDLPSIPAVSNTYVPGNTGAALTSKGVEGALENYVPKSRIISGSGALSGGGDLSANRAITHNLAPSGLNTEAIKIGVDSYGHVCAGTAITPSDIGAAPLKTVSTVSIAGLDGSNSSIAVIGTQSETLGFSVNPDFGREILINYVNNSANDVVITIPSSLVANTFLNGTRITSDTGITVGADKSLEIRIIVYQASGTSYGFISTR